MDSLYWRCFALNLKSCEYEFLGKYKVNLHFVTYCILKYDE